MATTKKRSNGTQGRPKKKDAGAPPQRSIPTPNTNGAEVGRKRAAVKAGAPILAFDPGFEERGKAATVRPSDPTSEALMALWNTIGQHLNVITIVTVVNYLVGDDLLEDRYMSRALAAIEAKVNRCTS